MRIAITVAVLLLIGGGALALGRWYGSRSTPTRATPAPAPEAPAAPAGGKTGASAGVGMPTSAPSLGVPSYQAPGVKAGNVIVLPEIQIEGRRI